MSEDGNEDTAKLVEPYVDQKGASATATTSAAATTRSSPM
jgi:hypothetical protein